MLLSILGLLLPPTTQHCMVPNAIVPRLRNPMGSFSAEACHIVAKCSPLLIYHNTSLQSLACTWASAGFTAYHTTRRFCSFSERCCSPQTGITRIPSQEALRLSSRKVPSFPSHIDTSIAFNGSLGVKEIQHHDLQEGTDHLLFTD